MSPEKAKAFIERASTDVAAVSEAVFSVSQASLLIKKHVEQHFDHVCIQGEVSAPKLHTSGHLYFSLKDDTAVLDAVCWRPLAHRFKDSLSHGTQVVCRGKITTYPGRSKYQMVVTEVSVAGQGDLFQLLEARKKKLREEGLFEASRKKALPPFPRCIGLITSPTGAVIQDILHRLADRFPVDVLFYPVNVQGEGALASMVEALDVLGQFASESMTPDVIILARGGGSFEDLFVFNEEALVRAMARCSLPVVSAIGHETDTTLADYVADQRAPTPTAAAEITTPHRASLAHTLTTYVRLIDQAWRQVLEPWCMRLHFFQQRLRRGYGFFPLYAQRLDDLEGRLQGYVDFWGRQQQRLAWLTARLTEPQTFVTMQETRFRYTQKALTTRAYEMLAQNTKDLRHLAQRLQQTSHEKALARGFCVALSPEGRVVTSKARGKRLSRLTMMFHDGKLAVRPVTPGDDDE
ncbi:exodeoxyribonuclease VII large subunit [Candidatus Hepatobacter penaei]|uniref:exodeoxyribonuclease VII large subunit n=1 Tax=Candidatus Hepatobacter penaei TaxID=1274402 RepID=UPI00069768A5|nr:exodeoxyribonuclease VII large subunit [Candidatus Hepatobacter penaei]